MELIRQISAIALVFALLGLTVWSLRRKGMLRLGVASRSKRGLQGLEIVGRLALSPHHSLQLVRVADRVLLIALHATGCTLLESRSWEGFQGLGASELPAPPLRGDLR